MADKNVNFRLMTLKEVADYLRVEEKTVHGLLDRKAIPATKVGKLWRFDSRAIDKWLQNTTIHGKAQVLVVDDEVQVRELLKAILEKLGHEVTTAESGLAGLKLMEKQDFNLVFLDLSLPSIDGIEIFRYIKVVYPCMPVVVMTEDPASKLTKQALYFGPFDVLNKPFSSEDVEQMINIFVKTPG
jgi:excisionase family DNA binding protein